MAKSPSGAMRKRMLWVAALIILVGFMTVTVRLFQLQIVDGAVSYTHLTLPTICSV